MYRGLGERCEHLIERVGESRGFRGGDVGQPRAVSAIGQHFDPHAVSAAGGQPGSVQRVRRRHGDVVQAAQQRGALLMDRGIGADCLVGEDGQRLSATGRDDQVCRFPGQIDPGQGPFLVGPQRTREPRIPEYGHGPEV
jgi:hypothetical protein